MAPEHRYHAQLQARDLALLKGLFESRLMTLAHVTAIHFEGAAEAAKKRVQKLKASGYLAERPRRAYDPSILHLTRQYSTLDGGANGYHFIGVHTFIGLLTKEFLNYLLYLGNTCRTAHKDHFIDLRSVQPGIFQRLFTRLQTSFKKAVRQLLELRTGQFLHQVFGNTINGRDIRQVDLRLGRRRQLDLGLLGRFAQAL